MKNFLIGFIVVVVALALGVGAAFAVATAGTKVAGPWLTSLAGQNQNPQLDQNDNNPAGPGMRRFGMPGRQQGQPRMGPGFQNQAPNGKHNGPSWNWNRDGQNGQNGQGIPKGQNGQNGPGGQDGQNNQNSPYYSCPNMDPGGGRLPRR
jgi:hypothetical protein